VGGLGEDVVGYCEADSYGGCQMKGICVRMNIVGVVFGV
jgi:hypothetical protein